MLQILATGFMIFSLQELMEAYSDHPGILSLSIEKAQGNFGRGLTSMKINLEYIKIQHINHHVILLVFVFLHRIIKSRPYLKQERFDSAQKREPSFWCCS